MYPLLKGLELNRFDTWSTHALTHTNEYATNFKEGTKFLLDTQNDWTVCNHLVPHNYWHLAVFYIQSNQHADAINVFNQHVRKPDDMCNSASFLMRLKVDGCTDPSLATKWAELKSEFVQKIEQHGYLYSDWHVALILGACGTDEEKATFMKTLDEYVNADGPQTPRDSACIQMPNFADLQNNYLKYVNKELARDVFQAVFSYNEGDFDRVVSLLYPIRYSLYKIGGSNAQTDIFNQLLVHSCLKSRLSMHNQLGLALINERLASRPNCELTKRMAARFFSQEEAL